MKNLKGKNALITGSSGGIGAGIAKKFAEEGVNVIIHYHVREQGAEETKKYVEAQGVTAKIFQADFRNSKETENLFKFATRELGNIDILINNAGAVLKGAIDQTEEEQFDDTTAVNIKAPYMLTKLFADHVNNNNQTGSIINISSIHAKQSTEYMSVYALTKAALDSLTQVAACELSPNIRVNSVAPGFTLTERNAATFQAVESSWSQCIAMRRFGQPADIASLVAFLCSDDAGWITGQSFNIDGGHLNRFNFPLRERP